MKNAQQIELSFDAGLLQRFPSYGDCVRASVYGCGKAFKSIAADLDMSASELSRKLSENPSDPVYFPARRLPELIAATGDLTPVYWLIEKFIESPETKRRRALDQLSELASVLPGLLKQAGIK